ncbi:MAG: 4Fe-4S binding protein [Caldisericia bacterium]|nr:4Fe-4S binding protein [Caldisericia bacterium]
MSKKQLQIYTIRIIFLGVFVFILFKKIPMLWLGLFVLSVLAAIFFGRVFCGWVCPMNTLMIMTDSIRTKTKIKPNTSPKWLKNGWLAWVLLVVSILTMILSKKLFHFEIPILLYLLILSVLVPFIYKPEVFPNQICTFGVLLGLTGSFAFLSRRVNFDKCIGCKLCETTCPSEAVIVSPQNKKAEINRKSCHQCYNCELICPQKAIDYGKKLKNN